MTLETDQFNAEPRDCICIQRMHVWPEWPVGRDIARLMISIDCKVCQECFLEISEC